MQAKTTIIKKISGDFLLNFIASAVVTAVMQLFMYPLISRIIGNVSYGNFLTIIGLINTISAVVGTTLNNVRLIRETDYKEKKIVGDFNFLLSIMIVVVDVISIPFLRILFGIGITEVFFVILLMSLMAVRGYWSVSYRIILNYKRIMFSNLILAAGYLIGCFPLLYCKIWLVPFITGEAAALIYIFFTTELYKESYGKTEFFSKILKDTLFIGVSTLSANVLIYLDRLILYPLLGGSAVTTYTVASVGGKFLGIIATPLTGVLLSYYAQPGFVMSRKRFWKISMATIGFASISLIIIIPISPFIIKILYPLAYESAMPIVPLACVAGIMSLICNFIQPSVLKIAPTSWQLIKEVVYGAVYIGLGYILLQQYGMMGFCMASIIALVVKIVILLVLGQIYSVREKEHNKIVMKTNRS